MICISFKNYGLNKVQNSSKNNLSCAYSKLCLLYDNSMNLQLLFNSNDCRSPTDKADDRGRRLRGKNSMFLSYYLKKFAKEYEPLVFNNSTTTIKVDGKIIILGLWDTAGQEEYAQLRPLAYSNVEIFSVAISLAKKGSFVNTLKTVIKYGRSSMLRYLVGFQMPYLHFQILKSTQEMAKTQVKQQLKGLKCLYHECSSALTHIGLVVFKLSVKEVLQRKVQHIVSPNGRTSFGCQFI